MRPRWLAAFAVAGCLAACAGCGASPRAASSATTTGPPPASATPARARTVAVGLTSAQLKPELLTVGELPTGWSTTPVTSSSGGFCGAGGSVKSTSSGSVEADFAEGQLPIFDEGLAAYAASPVPGFEKAVALLNACTSFNDSGTKLTVGQLSFPKIVPDLAAYQFSGSVKGFTLALDLVLATKGRQVVLLGYGGLGTPDTTQLTTFATMALAKMPAT